eukprot:Blabericola_migrator_1__7380@NODE_3757_length_1532_cov_37_279181_g2335_i0_p1_GENE_NODE_3757_length_1532_cov_37_279181_g2335_i0NODE_3757_length_1532_cov_37_279181_g2335_i0_p1_ORF_typecomplete_len143_score21_18Mtc/PF03820_17/0_09DUF5585/PF17823_1/0_15CBM_35/PF16990_5/0_19Endomucin/PF07010_12/3_5e02Endomucin/PF07010_12/2_8_NODE_3757_length_1532_cov_37_279181_g2335_i010031431
MYLCLKTLPQERLQARNKAGKKLDGPVSFAAEEAGIIHEHSKPLTRPKPKEEPTTRQVHLVAGPNTIKLEEYEKMKRDGQTVEQMDTYETAIFPARMTGFVQLMMARIMKETSTLRVWQWIYLLIVLPVGILLIMMSLVLFT